MKNLPLSERAANGAKEVLKMEGAIRMGIELSNFCRHLVESGHVEDRECDALLFRVTEWEKAIHE